MVKNNNNINWILDNFNDGDTPSQFDLKFVMATDLPNNLNAEISKIINNTITIKINQNNLNRSSLSIARTLLHEGIHARLKEFAYGKNTDAATFEELYEYMRIHGKKWQHEQMAALYRQTIAEGLRQYDSNQHSDPFYNDLAWEGLHNTTVFNGFSKDEQTRIANVINNDKKNGNKTCK